MRNPIQTTLFLSGLCSTLWGCGSLTEQQQPNEAGKNIADTTTYNITLSADNPYAARVTADTSTLTSFELQPPRSNQRVENKLHPTFYCDDKPIALGTQPRTVSCKQLRWSIFFKPRPELGVNPAAQQNIVSATSSPWWLITEWDSLPRIANVKGTQVCATFGKEQHCKPFPTTDQPPLFMSVGNQLKEYSLGTLDVTLYSELEKEKADELMHKFVEISQYLYEVFPSNDSPSDNDNSWELTWLTKEKSSGHYGGAAGYHSFMANYLQENGQPTAESDAILLRISAHESVHVISRLKLPGWAEESLPQYYAFKALNKLSVDDMTALQFWQQTKEKTPHSQDSLYQAEQQIEENHDMSYFPLVYGKGAAFWNEVDNALQRNGEDLDSYISQLDQQEFREGKLPTAFETSLQNGIGVKAWKKIKSDYLLANSEPVAS
ncbi:hypothetical protein EDC56_0502 [Sinobacterium caligoides]|uniref:Uncharacterized protein n=2 Tax=Sinobacterium caligoides TaxID=933926 RepID=A0A3N2DYV7_9GAMM|nr:hypothetical protein EDC56_0502 [Sinobacterium caligoides]